MKSPAWADSPCHVFHCHNIETMSHRNVTFNYNETFNAYTVSTEIALRLRLGLY